MASGMPFGNRRKAKERLALAKASLGDLEGRRVRLEAKAKRARLHPGREARLGGAIPARPKGEARARRPGGLAAPNPEVCFQQIK